MDGVSSGDVKVVEISGKSRRERWCDLVLRLLGLIFTLIAAVVGGVNKESRVVAVTVIDTLPPLHIPVTAKWYYMSAFRYFVVSSAIACAYAAVSLLLSATASRTIQNGVDLSLLVLDLLMVALLFSANGAAAAIGVIGINGNSHAKWNKVCNMVNTFCRHSMASFAMSMLGSVAFLCLVLLATLNFHKRSRMHNANCS
ncbi:hypothetical protein NMG60_11013881 [Bertholletia excelsa]